jgi:23S rRNA (guanine2445-N2)-methyltransferase / 23S rRNA (guanine2069-N7)-methyltransferase
VDRQQPDARINVYLHRGEVNLSLDLSGGSLHRRRGPGGAAPLKESLAAAILLRAGWPEIAASGGCLLDPMCGSGTLLIEGAWLAADCAPGLAREYYGFFGWRQHQPEIWQALLAEARERRQVGLDKLPPIIGYDANPRELGLAQENVAGAGLAGKIHLARQALADLQCPQENGLLVVNPPYGERLGEVEHLKPLYTALGEKLKNRFPGWYAAVFTGNPELGKHLGLRARRIHTLYNGALECKLLRFEVAEKYFVEAGPRVSPLRPAHPLVSSGEEGGSAMFANRLRKNLKHLGRWARREGVTCYRVYDADLPEYAVAVDWYEQWAQVQEYAPPKSVDPDKARQRLEEALAVIPAVLGIAPERIFVKVRQRQKGAAQYEKMGESGRFHEVHEHGAVFLLNFTDYLDTGLFLDHRPTRALLRQLAQGRRFLNLFAYTGTATVQAALGGALATTSVDLSHTYLDWARRNLARNGFSEHHHEFIQADCLEWLAGEKRHYGLIFLDPPTFSNSKRMDETLDIQRDHVQLIRLAAARLEPDGILIFSSNARRFRLEQALLSNLRIEDLSAATLPEDFKRNPRIHQCWRISRIR